MQRALGEGSSTVHETCSVLAKDCASFQPERGCGGDPCMPSINLRLASGHLLLLTGQQCRVGIIQCTYSHEHSQDWNLWQLHCGRTWGCGYACGQVCASAHGGGWGCAFCFSSLQMRRALSPQASAMADESELSTEAVSIPAALAVILPMALEQEQHAHRVREISPLSHRQVPQPSHGVSSGPAWRRPPAHTRGLNLSSS